MRIVLASQSPRRAWLLLRAGVAAEVEAAHVDETVHPGEKPVAYALRVAREKRDAILARHHDAAVVAADTVVALDDDVLGKPADASEAAATLRRLSGRTHQVHTAVAVGTAAERRDRVVSVAVSFRPLGDDDIDAYVRTGEPMDKAGAYGVQGEGGALVDEVRGSYTAVVGLPLKETLELLRGVGAIA